MSTPTPTAADVARIAALADDAGRNLRITHCYHELSLALRRRSGAGANWCTFATWASKQAGRTIRREDLREALRARLRGSATVAARLGVLLPLLREQRPARDAAAVVDGVVQALEEDAAFQRAASAVAAGNRKVFEEIAHEFARFLQVLDGAGEGAVDPDAAFAVFTGGLRPGDPPEGQEMLRDAFAAYRRALAERDGKRKAELIFHANLLIGLHEQTRLQPEIAAALNAAFDAHVVRRRLLARLLPGTWLRLRHRLASLVGRRPPLDEALDSLLAEVQRELRRLLTATTMTLHFPAGVVIRLGRDLDAAFPASLQTLADPGLSALLGRIDPTAGSVSGSGARDWADLPQRMHLIANLFRCYHEWEPLFEAPFSAEQVEALLAGRLPPGPL